MADWFAIIAGTGLAKYLQHNTLADYPDVYCVAAKMQKILDPLLPGQRVGEQKIRERALSPTQHLPGKAIN